MLSQLTTYIDESGSPVFRAPPNPRVHDGYVVAAVGVPTPSKDSLNAILPRSCSGHLQKANDRDLGPERLALFVSDFLKTDATLSLVMLETTSAENAKSAADFVAIASARRRERHNPLISEAGLLYMKIALDAIALSWASARPLTGPDSQQRDLVLDHANLSAHDSALMREMLTKSSRVLEGFNGSAIWASEAEEPLLLLPDLLAFVYRRSATHGDVREARDQLEQALANGRIQLQDGITTRDYGPELQRRGLETRT